MIDHSHCETIHPILANASPRPQGAHSSLDLKPHPTVCADGVFLSNTEIYRGCFRLGMDTLEIANLFKITEAEVYNSLAKK